MPARRGAAVTAAGECEAVGAGINSSKRRGRRSWEGIGGPRRRWQDSRSKETEGADGGIFFSPSGARGPMTGYWSDRRKGATDHEKYQRPCLVEVWKCFDEREMMF